MFDTRHHMTAAVCYVYCFALITRAPSTPMSIFKLTDEKGENFLPSFVILQTNALASCENIFHARLSIENTGKCGSNARKFSQKSFSDSLYSYYFSDGTMLLSWLVRLVLFSQARVEWWPLMVCHRLSCCHGCCRTQTDIFLQTLIIELRIWHEWMLFRGANCVRIARENQPACGAWKMAEWSLTV